MLVIICYDIPKNKIRSRLVKYLERIAVRIQYSVFIGDLERGQISELKNYASDLFDGNRENDLQVFALRDADWAREKYLPAHHIYI